MLYISLILFGILIFFLLQNYRTPTEREIIIKDIVDQAEIDSKKWLEAKRQAEEMAKREEAELKAQQLKLQQEAEAKIQAEEKVKQEETKRKAHQLKLQQEEEERRKEEEKLKCEKELNDFLIYKTDFQLFKETLSANGIQTLYHFTDKANLDFIRKYGGLYSWDYLNKMNYNVPYQGGGELSKQLDLSYRLQDYVRLSFTRNHPMMFVAKKDGRLPNPVVLKIKLDVCFFKDTKFADMNATRTGHSHGGDIADLRRIKFDIVKQEKHFDLEQENQRYYQAEVLVKRWIPIEYIIF